MVVISPKARKSSRWSLSGLIATSPGPLSAFLRLVNTARAKSIALCIAMP